MPFSPVQLLRRKVILVILSVFVIGSLTMNFYFLNRLTASNKALAKLRMPSEITVTEYNRYRRPAEDQLLIKLVEFGKTNADFGAILAKYNLTSQTVSNYTGIHMPANR